MNAVDVVAQTLQLHRDLGPGGDLGAYYCLCPAGPFLGVLGKDHETGLDEITEAFERHQAQAVVDALTEAGWLLPTMSTVKELFAADALIDPDCKVGKHQSCVGDPCECSCHARTP